MKKYKAGDYSDIDVEGLLDHYGIEFKTSGKNVGQNWIGVCCPYCGEERFHCGINMDTKVTSCFVCGESGTLLKLISTLLKCPWQEAKEFLKPFGGHYSKFYEPQYAKEVIFPTRISDLTKVGTSYLKSRGFNPKELINKYFLKETGMLSKLVVDNKVWDFKNRIIIPIIMNRQIVSYTARDWTNVSSTRYKNAPTEAGLIPIAECIYNIDNTKKSVIIVEGPTDVWKMGDGCISILGVKYTTAQVQQLVQKKFRKIVILFDENAEKPALQLATTLNPFVNISVFTTINKDPGDLTIAEVAKLKFQLLEDS